MAGYLEYADASFGLTPAGHIVAQRRVAWAVVQYANYLMNLPFVDPENPTDEEKAKREWAKAAQQNAMERASLMLPRILNDNGQAIAQDPIGTADATYQTATETIVNEWIANGLV